MTPGAGGQGVRLVRRDYELGCGFVSNLKSGVIEALSKIFMRITTSNEFSNLVLVPQLIGEAN